VESNWEMLFTNLQFILNFVWIHVNNEICFIITKYSICTVCFKNKSYHVNKRVLKPLLKLEMWYYFISNGVPQTFQNTISFLSDVSTCWHPKLNCKKKKDSLFWTWYSLKTMFGYKRVPVLIWKYMNSMSSFFISWTKHISIFKSYI